MPDDEPGRDRWRRYWDKHSANYDKQTGFFDRHLFGDSRAWVCSRATGHTLEVAIGTGLNLPFYGEQVQLAGIDFSPAMLAVARDRAARLGRTVDLRVADALALPFPDASFDTTVCTFSLCAIPDDRLAVAEMGRVLRPGGQLLLADHVEASAWPARGIQRAIELFTVPLQGEHFTRRPCGTSRPKDSTSSSVNGSSSGSPNGSPHVSPTPGSSTGLQRAWLSPPRMPSCIRNQNAALSVARGDKTSWVRPFIRTTRSRTWTAPAKAETPDLDRLCAGRRPPRG